MQLFQAIKNSHRNTHSDCVRALAIKQSAKLHSVFLLFPHKKPGNSVIKLFTLSFYLWGWICGLFVLRNLFLEPLDFPQSVNLFPGQQLLFKPVAVSCYENFNHKHAKPLSWNPPLRMRNKQSILCSSPWSQAVNCSCVTEWMLAFWVSELHAGLENVWSVFDQLADEIQVTWFVWWSIRLTHSGVMATEKV